MQVLTDAQLFDALTEFKGTVRTLILMGANAPDLESLLRCDFEMADRLPESRRRELHTMPYDEFLRTEEWQRTRELALERSGRACQACYFAEGLNVHHRTYERRGYELPEDLTVLCVACHTAVHLVVDARAGKVRPVMRRVYE